MKHKHGLIWNLRFNLGMRILPYCALETIENALESRDRVNSAKNLMGTLFKDRLPTEEQMVAALKDLGINARVIRIDLSEEDLPESDETAGD